MQKNIRLDKVTRELNKSTTTGTRGSDASTAQQIVDEIKSGKKYVKKNPLDYSELEINDNIGGFETPLTHEPFDFDVYIANTTPEQRSKIAAAVRAVIDEEERIHANAMAERVSECPFPSDQPTPPLYRWYDCLRDIWTAIKKLFSKEKKNGR